MTWGQCLFYTLWRWHLEGGRPNFRTSDHWPIAHAQYADGAGMLHHFVPPGDLKTPVHSLIGFYGEVIHHDFVPCRPMPIWGIVASTFLLFVGSVIWAIWAVLCKLLRVIP